MTKKKIKAPRHTNDPNWKPCNDLSHSVHVDTSNSLYFWHTVAWSESNAREQSNQTIHVGMIVYDTDRPTEILRVKSVKNGRTFGQRLRLLHSTFESNIRRTHAGLCHAASSKHVCSCGDHIHACCSTRDLVFTLLCTTAATEVVQWGLITCHRSVSNSVLTRQ